MDSTHYKEAEEQLKNLALGPEVDYSQLIKLEVDMKNEDEDPTYATDMTYASCDTD